MSDCNCNQTKAASSEGHVPNFAVAGFADTGSADNFENLRAQLTDVDALRIQVCVNASYDPATHQVCVQIPILGRKCFTLPIPVPIGAQLKACVDTCGIIPCGAKITIYLNNTAIYTYKFGCC
ncbi:hypothetical protein C8247_08460 [Paracidovorax avenae]|uniref:hypothetical protein n=1 Tax=Paracidovorax avenae TaxID=80867 RepID=UPI000D17ADEC|nr:hypothetical protein [Paracidovorax avenae]AVS70455.1 hypothetical protein C8247_08460 [Paracidovorax avenae]